MQPTSTEHQFTAPPWTYDFSPNEGHDSEFLVFGPRNAELAYVGADEARGVIGPMVESNARLIAAAPELLGIAKAIYQPFLDGNLYADHDHASELLGELRKTIAKAEGRTS